MTNKKGVSPIVATLFIILLVIVLFAIISFSIRKLGKGTTEKIELSNKCLQIEIQATNVLKTPQTRANYTITLERSVQGSGINVDGVDLIFYDSSNTETVTSSKTSITPLQKWTESVALVTLANTIPNEVTVVPFILKEDGTKHLCDTTSIFNF